MTMSLLALLLGAAPLHAGDRAPDFTLSDTERRQITLSRELAKGPVVLFFFPKAGTPG